MKYQYRADQSHHFKLTRVHSNYDNRATYTALGLQVTLELDEP